MPYSVPPPVKLPTQILPHRPNSKSFEVMLHRGSRPDLFVSDYHLDYMAEIDEYFTFALS